MAEQGEIVQFRVPTLSNGISPVHPAACCSFSSHIIYDTVLSPFSCVLVFNEDPRSLALLLSVDAVGQAFATISPRGLPL